MSKFWSIIVVSCLGYHAGFSQALDFTTIRAEVDFSWTLQEWDGFGFNYVETAHSSDMEKFNQEYGGFSLLDDNEKREIIDMVFGEDGLKVRPGYYFYKQITWAGQPGMKVAQASAMDSELAVIAFSANGTKHPDAFIISNINKKDQKVKVTIKGTDAKAFKAFRTTKSPGSDLDHIDEKYVSLGDSQVEDGTIVLDAPAGSVTTFFAK